MGGGGPSCPSVLYFKANMNALPCTSSPGSGRWATSCEKNSFSQSDCKELGSLHVSNLDSRKGTSRVLASHKTEKRKQLL